MTSEWQPTALFCSILYISTTIKSTQVTQQWLERTWL